MMETIIDLTVSNLPLSITKIKICHFITGNKTIYSSFSVIKDNSNKPIMFSCASIPLPSELLL